MKLELTLSDLEEPWMLNMDCRDGCQDRVLEDHAAMEMGICLDGGPQEAVDYLVEILVITHTPQERL